MLLTNDNITPYNTEKQNDETVALAQIFLYYTLIFMKFQIRTVHAPVELFLQINVVYIYAVMCALHRMGIGYACFNSTSGL